MYFIKSVPIEKWVIFVTFYHLFAKIGNAFYSKVFITRNKLRHYSEMAKRLRKVRGLFHEKFSFGQNLFKNAVIIDTCILNLSLMKGTPHIVLGLFRKKIWFAKKKRKYPNAKI